MSAHFLVLLAIFAVGFTAGAKYAQWRLLTHSSRVATNAFRYRQELEHNFRELREDDGDGMCCVAVPMAELI